uniref:Polyprotein n=1 Tax=Solanum tuberosum TaxID=4113 RepID=M1DA51_SOLTU
MTGPTDRRSGHGVKCTTSNKSEARLRSVLGKLHFLDIGIVRKSVTNQNNQQAPVPANASGGSVAARVRDFGRMNSSEFLGSQIGEDPQNFIDEVKKIFGVMQAQGGNNSRAQSTTSAASAGHPTQHATSG